MPETYLFPADQLSQTFQQSWREQGALELSLDGCRLRVVTRPAWTMKSVDGSGQRQFYWAEGRVLLQRASGLWTNADQAAFEDCLTDVLQALPERNHYMIYPEVDFCEQDSFQLAVLQFWRQEASKVGEVAVVLNPFFRTHAMRLRLSLSRSAEQLGVYEDATAALQYLLRRPIQPVPTEPTTQADFSRLFPQTPREQEQALEMISKMVLTPPNEPYEVALPEQVSTDLRHFYEALRLLRGHMEEQARRYQEQLQTRDNIITAHVRQLEDQLEWARFAERLGELTSWRVRLRTMRLEFQDQNDWEEWGLPARLRERPALEIAEFMATELVHPEDATTFLRTFQNALETWSGFDITFRMRDASGVWLHVRNLATFHQGASEEAFLMGGLQDLTLMTVMHDERRRHQQRMEAAVAQAYHPILLLSLEGAILKANHAAEDLLQGQLVGKSLHSLVQPEERPLVDQLLEQLAGGAQKRLQAMLQMWRSERPLPVRLSLAAILDGQQELEGLIAHVEDLSELRTTQDMLAQSARLATIGETAASLAHELKSPLGAIRLKAEMLMMLCEAQESLPSARVNSKLQEVVKIADKANQLLQQMRNFSRNAQREEKQYCQLSVILTDVLLLIQGSLDKSQVKVHLKLPPQLPPVWGNPTQLEQVFINLFSNARDAMEHRSNRQIIVSAEGVEVMHVQVKDTGAGMSEEVRSRLFESFYTTKKRGEGTGLGMAIVRRIIEEHHGTIEVESVVNEGTTFHLRLPLNPEFAKTA
jgi:PAS domain S-box-containing protein